MFLPYSFVLHLFCIRLEILIESQEVMGLFRGEGGEGREGKKDTWPGMMGDDSDSDGNSNSDVFDNGGLISSSRLVRSSLYHGFVSGRDCPFLSQSCVALRCVVFCGAVLCCVRCSVSPLGGRSVVLVVGPQ